MSNGTNKKVEPPIRPLPEEEKKTDEKKEFLVRGEIKTMEKDIQKLREGEAEEERERIAKLRIGEEKRREQERQIQAEKEAKEREEVKLMAEKKEEELKRMKEERKREEKITTEEELKKEMLKTEEFKEKMIDIQAKEEEERRKFLERVEVKAEEKAEISRPTPPPVPPPPVPPPVKPPEPRFGKPSLPQKLWIRIALSVLGFLALAGIGIFFYWFFAVREAPLEQKPEAPTGELTIPQGLIPIEASEIIEISELSQTLAKDLEEGQFLRIVIKDAEGNKALNLKEFFQGLEIEAPEGLYDKLGADFTLFIYSQKEGKRLGLLTKIQEKEGLPELLSSWEPTMEKDTELLFSILGKEAPALVSYFRDAEHQNVEFRYQTFSRQDLGICYVIFKDYFLFSSSWKIVEATLEALGAGKESSRAPKIPLATPAPGSEFTLPGPILFETILRSPPTADSINLPILLYHHIGYLPEDAARERWRITVSPETFEAQIKYLSGQGYGTLSFQEVVDHFNSQKEIPEKSLIITFDDGWESQYYHALPILKKYGFKATFFIVVSRVGEPSFMSWDELKELAEAGMEIGSHGMSHSNLVGLSQGHLEYEIRASKTILEEKLGIPINSFAYPYGSFDSKVAEMVKATYFTARSTIDGTWQNPEDIFSLKAVSIYDNFNQFKETLASK